MKKLLSSLVVLATLSACSNPFAPTVEQVPTTTIPVSTNGTSATTTDNSTVQFGNISVSTDLVPSYKIFMIAMEDKGLNGKEIGCSDSAVAVDGKSTKTFDKPEDKISAALTELFSIKTKDYGESGFTNSLAASNLKVESVTIDEKDSGHFIIKLSGNLSMAGECDNPRVEAQISETVLQFPEIGSADILLNDQPLQDAVSLKG